MTDPTGDLVDQLLRQPPEAIEAWARRPDVPSGFNWRGLAEVAGFEALSGDLATGRAWARVAVLAHDRMGAATPDPHERARHAVDVMRLRAELIARHGAVPGDPLLDCDGIFRWFLDRRAGAYEAVVRDAERWRELPIERIRDLRYVKHELNVLRRLDRCGPYATPEVQRWLQLWDRLP